MPVFMSYEDRLQIQKSLTLNESFKCIAKKLGKDPTTISREVKKYHKVETTGSSSFKHNACIHRKTCKKKTVCNTCFHLRDTYCKHCGKCNQECSYFVEEVCVSIKQAPYVCNSCDLVKKCTLIKQVYDAKHAHITACAVIANSREGFSFTEDELGILGALITPLIRKGQPIHHIYHANKEQIHCCEKTLYNLIDACKIDARNIDLPAKVQRRQSRKKRVPKMEREYTKGRDYESLLSFLKSNPENSMVQMDTVIGKVGGKCLLTIHFVDSSFMLGFLRDSNDVQSVIDIFNALDKQLGSERFNKLFPLITTDRGSEFSNSEAIEYREYTKESSKLLRTSVFYCDAYAAYQKGAIENNHKLIRRILPKGTSFDHLTQADINVMMNRINSLKRKKLNDRCPYETFSFYHGEEVLRTLGCEPVPAEDIQLKPNLLKK